jgi:hypothetical protein
MDSITQHLYVPRTERGKGMMQIEGAYTAEAMKLKESVESKEDPPIHTDIAQTHQYFKHFEMISLNSKVKHSK